MWRSWGGKSHFNVISLFCVLLKESQNPRDAALEVDLVTLVTTNQAATDGL